MGFRGLVLPSIELAQDTATDGQSWRWSDAADKYVPFSAGSASPIRPFWDDFTVPNSSTTQYVLSNPLYIDSETVTLHAGGAPGNGARLAPTAYALDGNVIIIGAGVTLNAGDVLTVHYWTPGQPTESSGVTNGGEFIDSWAAATFNVQNHIFNAPASTQVGDLLLAWLGFEGPLNALPAGWTVIGSYDDPGGLPFSVYGRLIGKVATAADLGASWTASTQALTNGILQCLTYRNVTINGFTLAGGYESTPQTTNAPSVAQSAAGLTIRGFYAGNDDNQASPTLAVAPGPTVRVNTTGVFYAAAAVADVTPADNSASGTVACTCSYPSNRWIRWTLALRRG